MPVAEKFKVLGAGNGFPFCLRNVNVLEYTKWTTFSGFNDESGGAPTQTQIDESFALAVKLFWNAYKLNCVSTVEGSTITSVDSENDAVERILTPKERISGNVRISKTINDLGDGEFTDSVEVILDIIPCKMYKGDVSNEANFIGYGFGEKSIELNEGNYFAIVYVSGYFSTEQDGDFLEAGYCSVPITNDSSSFAGVCIGFSAGAPYDESSFDATAMKTYYSYTDITLEIKSIELYTYPE